MKIRASRLARAWEHAEMRRWLQRRFPDHCWGKPEGEIDAYLADREERARALGFERASHLQHLLDYELGSGLAVLDPCAGTEVPEVSRVLAQREVDPDLRIEAAERIVFGEAGDG
jgi:hypothetical protein